MIVVRRTQGRPDVCQDEVSRRLAIHRNLRGAIQNAPAIAALLHAPFFLLVFASGHPRDSLVATLGVLLLWSVMVLLVTVVTIYNRNLSHLLRIDDVRVVGPLLDLMEPCLEKRLFEPDRPRSSTETRVMAALPALLAQMSAGDGPTLSQEQRATLRRLMAHPEFRHEL